MASYLVTESSRGIGLKLVTYLLSLPGDRVKTVFATARDSRSSASLVSLANSPQGLGRIVLVTFDMWDNDCVDHAVVTIQRALGPKNGLDVLINNTGVLPERQNIIQLTDDDVARNLETVMRAFLPLMHRGGQKKVVNLDSTLDSMTISTQTGEKGTSSPVSEYVISKTALSVINTKWAMMLKDDGFIVAGICPGWARDHTEGGRVLSAVGIECKAIIERIDNLDQTGNGKFLEACVPGIENAESTQNDGS